MARRTKYRDRNSLAQWVISIYQDAAAFHYEHPVFMARLKHVWESPDYKRLPLYSREYISGFERCYYLHVIERSCTESGSWVKMPDGTEQYFGVRERLGMGTESLNKLYPQLAEYGIHRYIHEHEIPEKAGIYWVDHLTKEWNGLHPFFIPALHSTVK